MPAYCACGLWVRQISNVSIKSLLWKPLTISQHSVGHFHLDDLWSSWEGEGREISLGTRPRPALGAGHQAPRQVVLNCPKMGPASQKEMFNNEGRRISGHFSYNDRLFLEVLVKSSTKLTKGNYFFAPRLKTQLAFCLAGFDSVEEKLLSFLSDMLCFRTKTKQRIKQQRKGRWNGMKKTSTIKSILILWRGVKTLGNLCWEYCAQFNLVYTFPLTYDSMRKKYG